MDNVPVHDNNQDSAIHHAGNRPTELAHHVRPRKNRVKLAAITVSAVLLIILLMVGGMFMYQLTMGSNIDGGKYQAVFLTNGQVYFGKLQGLNGNYMKLTDIYYLQAKSSSTSNPQQTSDQAATDVQLIKLGSEIHGPVDEMIVSKDQILFFENLKTDSKVSKSIATYQTQKK